MAVYITVLQGGDPCSKKKVLRQGAVPCCMPTPPRSPFFTWVLTDIWLDVAIRPPATAHMPTDISLGAAHHHHHHHRRSGINPPYDMAPHDRGYNTPTLKKNCGSLSSELLTTEFNQLNLGLATIPVGPCGSVHGIVSATSIPGCDNPVLHPSHILHSIIHMSATRLHMPGYPRTSKIKLFDHTVVLIPSCSHPSRHNLLKSNHQVNPR